MSSPQDNNFPSQKFMAVAVLMMALALAASGCGLRSASGAVLDAEPGSVEFSESLEGVEITVGAKNFTEQLILGNMYSILLNTAGMEVTNRSNTPGSNGVRNALLNGSIDVSPDYTGTGWINYLGNTDPVEGEQAQWEAVREADLENGLTWLPYAPMSNTYAFATGPEATERLGVENLSDIADLPVEERTFCVESEFASRNDGFVPMLETYGLTLGEDVPEDQVTTLDTGAVYSATADGVCNFGEVFSTDGRILALDLTVLEDDEQFFPRYNLSAVIDTELLEEHPEIADIFAQLHPELTDEVMLELNAQVDVEGRQPALVALDWLEAEGFVE